MEIKAVKAELVGKGPLDGAGAEEALPPDVSPEDAADGLLALMFCLFRIVKSLPSTVKPSEPRGTR